METWDAIRARRNVRAYAEKPVAAEHLQRIAEAGWRAPSILGVPGTHLVAYLLGVGYPADRPLRPVAAPKRRPFDEVVHRERW